MIGECVISAAGASSRMGAWKPLLPFGSSTIIGTTVAAARNAGLRVVLVTGFRGDELAAVFTGDSGVVCVENPAWERGLLGSMIAGLTACSGGQAFLMNGDKPLVRPETYALLAREAERRRAAGLADAALFASSGGKAGHPVLVNRDAVLSAYAALDAAASSRLRMRDLLAELEPVLIECGDEGVLLDIDSPADYSSLRPR